MILAALASVFFAPAQPTAPSAALEWNFTAPAAEAAAAPQHHAAWAGVHPPHWGGEDRGLIFDGYDSGLTVAAAPALDFREALAIEAVFSTDLVHDFAALVWKGERLQSGTNRIAYWFGLSGDRLILQAMTPSGQWGRFVETSARIVPGITYRVFVRFDRGQVTGRLDERELRFQAGGERITTLPLVADTALWIGHARGSYGFRAQMFKGRISRLRLSADAVAPVFPLPEPAPPVSRAAVPPPEVKLTDWAVAVLPATEKVIPPRALIPDAQPTATLDLARGEHEHAQIVLLAGPQAGSVSVSVGELRAEQGGGAFAGRVTLARLDTITTSPPRYAVPHVGAWPDPLWPHASGDSLALTPHERRSVLLSVHAPRGAASGLYRSTVTVADERRQVRIPVTVRVRAFALPERFGFPVSFSFDEPGAARYYGQRTLTSQQRARIHAMLSDYHLGVGDIYAASGYPAAAEWPQLHERGQTALSIASFSRRHRLTDAAARQQLETNVAAVKQAGLADRAFIYGYDEITFRRELFELCREDYALAGKIAPGIPRMITGAPIPELDDVVDIWNIPLGVWHESMAGPLRARGKKMWLYTTGETGTELPDLLLDQDGIKHRMLFWLLWKYRADGYLLWRINRGWLTNTAPGARWPAKPWEPRLFNDQAGRWSRDNGNGNLIWPHPDPEQPPLPGLRLELIRDGLEDMEYLALLARRADKLRNAAAPAPDAAALLAKADATLAKAAALVDTPRSYNLDTATLQRVRLEIADLIESMPLSSD